MTGRRPRVLVLNHFAVPRDQPGGTRHVDLFERLNGWDYTIVASRLNLSTRTAQPATPGFVFVPVTPYGSNGIARILNWISYAAMACVAAVRLPRPDVVYASSPHLLAGLAGWIIARTRRARFVLEIRDLWPQVLVDMRYVRQGSAVHRVLCSLEGFLYRRAQAIIVLAPGARLAIERLGIPAERITCIPNAAEVDAFVPTTDRQTLREKYGFQRLTGIYAGAHGPANGLDLLLAAAKEARALPLDIVLVGDGVDKARLVERARADALDNVRFLDPVPKSEIPDLLAAADFGIHVLADVALFRSSVSPNKVFDYLAAGRCVLTNAPGVVSDIVDGAGAGLTVAPNDLARGLAAIAESQYADLIRSGAQGKKWISTHHSTAAASHALRRVLRQVSP